MDLYPTSIQGWRRLESSLSGYAPKKAMAICREMCRNSLYFLIRYGLQRTDIENQWILDRCIEVEQSPDGHLDLWAREHYKSTIVTYGKTIQDILTSHGEDPIEQWNGVEPCFGFFSHTRGISKTFLRQVKWELETNQLLKELFPDVLFQDPHTEAPKWSEDDGIIVRRKKNRKEATLEAWGIVDGQPTAKHFDVRVYDDVVTEDSVATSSMMDKTTKAWELSLNLGVEGGRERYVGTRYDDGDTYGAMITREAVDVRLYTATADGRADGVPVFMSPDYLAYKRRGMSPATFSAQMLLDPVPEETAYFKKTQVNYYEEAPKHLYIYGASDYAVTEDDGDWTEHGIVGVDPDEDIYVLAWWRGQTQADEWIEVQLDLAAEHKPLLWIGESGVIRKAVEPFLNKRMNERKVYLSMVWLPSIRDKPIRARAYQARFAQGKVYFPYKAPFTSELIRQHLRFPRGSEDDGVDVMSLFGRALEDMVGGVLPKEPPPREDSWARAFRRTRESQTWKTM